MLISLFVLQALWLSENQAKPMLAFQTDYDEQTGDQVKKNAVIFWFFIHTIIKFVIFWSNSHSNQLPRLIFSCLFIFLSFLHAKPYLQKYLIIIYQICNSLLSAVVLYLHKYMVYVVLCIRQKGADTPLHTPVLTLAYYHIMQICECVSVCEVSNSLIYFPLP